MLWLCAHLPRLALESLASDDPRLAVTDQRGSQRWIVAARADLAPGTPLGAALALEPNLRAVPRRLAAERAQLKSLAHGAYRFSSQVTARRTEPAQAFELPCHELWLEIGASLRLFGGLDALRRSVGAQLEAQGTSFTLGVAPTLEGAALLARAGIEDSVHNPIALRRVIAPLPLSLLRLPAATQQVLHGAGLRRVGEVLALPREAFARRFGAAALAALDRLTGAAPDTRAFIQPPPRFARRFELLGEVESRETLLFPLRRLFAELQHYLRARDTGVQEFRLAFEHAHAAPSVLDFRLVAPSRQAQHFLLLARERLEREVLPAPVAALSLSAERFAAPEAPQLDLFGEAQQREQQWRALLETLVARLGERAVFGLDLVEDHRPEKSWTATPLEPAAPPPKRAHLARRDAARPARPAWLLREPRPLARPPEALQALSGDELIEGGWWDGADVCRAYYTVRDARGPRLWVFQDLATERWYLHGLWA